MTRLSALFFSALIFCAVGCLRTSTTVIVHRNGSATIIDTTLLTKQTMEMWKEMAKASKQKLEDVLRQDMRDTTAAQRAAQMGEGVEFVQSSFVSRNGMAGYVTTFSARDVALLQINKNQFHEKISTDSAGKAEAPAFVRFERNGGQFRIISEPLAPSQDESELDSELTDKEIANQVNIARKFMKDLDLALRVTFESGIADTDAMFVRDNTITLIHIPFNAILKKMQKDPQVFRYMAGIATPAPWDMEKEFNKLGGGVVMETKPVVTVKLRQ